MQYLPGFLSSILFSPWMQTGIVVTVLFLFAVFSRFSEKTVISTGAYICFVWILSNIVLSLFVGATFWSFLLQWFLSTLAFFLIYFLLIYLSGRFGSPYSGDGGFMMVLPIYGFVASVAGSIFIKGCIWIVKSVYENV